MNSSDVQSNTTVGLGQERPGYATALLLFFIINVIGNSLVWLVSTKKIHKKVTSFQVLVVSLATSDLLHGLSQILPQVINNYAGRWVLGRTFCKIHIVMRNLCSSTSVINMLFIAILRYRTVENMKCTFTKRCMAIIMCVWIYCIAISAPLGDWYTVQDDSCTWREEAYDHVKLYTIITSGINFFIPLVISCGCYIGVIWKTVTNSKRMRGFKGAHLIRKMNRSRSVTITCLLIICLFVLTRTPLHVFMMYCLAFDVDRARQLTPMWIHFWFPTVINSSSSPFVYVFIWQSFRSELKKIFKVGQPIKVAPIVPMSDDHKPGNDLAIISDYTLKARPIIQLGRFLPGVETLSPSLTKPDVCEEDGLIKRKT